jgi:hypothetical protein
MILLHLKIIARLKAKKITHQIPTGPKQDSHKPGSGFHAGFYILLR